MVHALEALRPAHWTARHGKVKASNQWMVYSEVLRGRIDDCKQSGEKSRGGYRIGILLADYDGKIQTSFSLFDCAIAAKRFKANFRSEMVEPLIALHGDGLLECEGTTMRSGNARRITTASSKIRLLDQPLVDRPSLLQRGKAGLLSNRHWNLPLRHQQANHSERRTVGRSLPPPSGVHDAAGRRTNQYQAPST